MEDEIYWCYQVSHKDYPLELLERKVLNKRGDWYGLVSKNEDHVPTYLAYVWLDKKGDTLYQQPLP
jgi:hypothetical protein